MANSKTTPARGLATTYVGRLYQQKWVLLPVACFLLLNLYLNFRKVESPPFYLWDLYSLPYPKTDTFTTYVLSYNKGAILNKHTLLTHQSGILFAYTIEKYAAFTQRGLQQSPFGRWPCNPEQERRALAAYPGWLKTYLSAVLKKPIHTLEIHEVNVIYTSNGRVVPTQIVKIVPKQI